jgi:hypothetical protein
VAIPEGEAWGVSAEIAVSNGGDWPAGEERKFAMDIACEAL